VTGARDVIAKRFSDDFVYALENCSSHELADAALDALLSAPDSIRLELAWQLCPELRYPPGKPLPTLTEDKNG